MKRRRASFRTEIRDRHQQEVQAVQTVRTSQYYILWHLLTRWQADPRIS